MDPLLALASIIAAGIGVQWLAWRAHVPSIFLLLLAGFVLGRITGLLDPDAILGPALFPIISLSVAVILFEGGLSLDTDELPQIGTVVWRLITGGALITGVGVTFLARALLGFDLGIAALLGAILIVTGPTVIIPMLRQIRPTASLASAARWEGIVNDPIGAILAVLVFDVVMLGADEGLSAVGVGIAKAVVGGGGLGLLGAVVLVVLIERYWVPDFLQSPVTLALVVAVFAIADWLQADSGLLAVTVMGSAVASQKRVPIRHIVQFKENLRVVLISTLFMILAARLPIDDPVFRDMRNIAFVAALILVVRPAAVFLSTVGTGLGWRERAFLSWIAPRGIVAAAVASIFSIELAEAGVPGADRFASVVFLVIVATVAVYGLTAGPLARWLGVATTARHGILLVGASRWVRDFARALHALQVPVLLIDANWRNIGEAKKAGLPAYYGNVLDEHIEDELDLERIGCLLAVTSNDEVNALATVHLQDVFERANRFQLAPERPAPGSAVGFLPSDLQGRRLFGQDVTWTVIHDRIEAGEVIKRTRLTDEFDYDAFRELYGADALVLAAVTPNGQVEVFTSPESRPGTGRTLISLVREPEEG